MAKRKLRTSTQLIGDERKRRSAFAALAGKSPGTKKVSKVEKSSMISNLSADSPRARAARRRRKKKKNR